MIFLVLSGKMVFFSREHNIFSLDGKWKTIFLKEYEETWYFMYNVQMSQAPLPIKSKMILPRKNTPKEDWHSRLTF